MRISLSLGLAVILAFVVLLEAAPALRPVRSSNDGRKTRIIKLPYNYVRRRLPTYLPPNDAGGYVKQFNNRPCIARPYQVSAECREESDDGNAADQNYPQAQNPLYQARMLTRNKPGAARTSPLAHVKPQVFEKFQITNQGADAKNWNTGEKFQFDNKQISTNGGKDQEITQKNSKDMFDQENNAASNSVNEVLSKDDGKGNLMNKIYQDESASSDSMDAVGGFANDNKDVFTDGGKDRETTSRGSRFTDMLTNKDASTGTLDNELIQKEDGTVSDRKYSNEAASSDKDKLSVADAHDDESISENFGQNQQDFNRQSSDMSHQGDGAQSFDTVDNQLQTDGVSTKQRDFQDKGSSNLIVDESSKDRDNNGQISQNFGENMQIFADNSEANSRDANKAAESLTNSVSLDENPDGTFFNQDFVNGASAEKSSVQDDKQKADQSLYANNGEKQEHTSDSSGQAHVALDGGASLHDFGFASGMDENGQYDHEHNNMGAESIVKENDLEHNRNQAQLTSDFGKSQEISDTGSVSKTGSGNSEKSNNDNASGEVTGNTGMHDFGGIGVFDDPNAMTHSAMD